jgi:ion channel
LLRSLGYSHVRHYAGGLEGWKASSGRIDTGDRAESTDRSLPSSARRRPPVRPLTLFFDRFARLSFGSLFALWLGVVVVFGVFYWLLELVHPGSVADHGVAIGNRIDGLLTAIYFSFVTATSVGFGDVVPGGIARALAVAESATELLVFGLVVSKLVSGRQEQLTEEIHRIAFEDRLGRVRTNLYMVLSELQVLSNDSLLERLSLDRLLQRLESAGMMLEGELRTVHDLLYRTQQVPEEPVLSAILTTLAAGLAEYNALCESLPDGRGQSEALEQSLTAIGNLAFEICGECVPREYAPTLRVSMDRIQEFAGRMRAYAA